MIPRQNLSHGDFIKICELARARDKKSLFAFLRERDENGTKRNITYCKRNRNYSPITFLAMHGEDQAIEFFLDEICAYPMDIMAHIVDGYLRGGHEKQAREYIERMIEIGKSDPEYSPQDIDCILIKLYAANARITEVNALLEKLPTLINYAVLGYISGHHDALAEELISQGASLEDAACAYACEGNAEKVEQMWRRIGEAGRKYNYSDVMDIYEKYGFFDSRYNILYLLVQTKSPQFCETIAVSATIYNSAYDDKELIKTANFTRLLMSKYDLSYDQAKAFTSPDEMTWLLQGQRFGHIALPLDVFIHITTYVTNTSNSEARKLYQQLSKQVHEGALKSVERKYAPGMISTLFSCVWPKAHREKVKLLDEKKSELHEKYDQHGRRK